MGRIYSKRGDLVANDRKQDENKTNTETKTALETLSLGRSKTSETSVASNGGTGVPLVLTKILFVAV